jgi:hypothetical protein
MPTTGSAQAGPVERLARRNFARLIIGSFPENFYKGFA